MLISMSSPCANSSVACSAGASGTYSAVMMDPKHPHPHPHPHTAESDPPGNQIAITVTPPGPNALVVSVPCLILTQTTWNCSSFPLSLAGKTGCTVKATLTGSGGGSTSVTVQNVTFTGTVPVPPVPPGPPPTPHPHKGK